MSDHIHRWALSQPFRDENDKQVTKAVCACGDIRIREEWAYQAKFTRHTLQKMAAKELAA